MSHRFVTVRRGSPAARSGQIQPGDQLEAVEGRPVGGLQHRDLAQILRRAGNTLRLSITPRLRMKHTHINQDTVWYMYSYSGKVYSLPVPLPSPFPYFLSSDASSLPEGADLDIDGRVMKGSRGRSKVTSFYYFHSWYSYNSTNHFNIYTSNSVGNIQVLGTLNHSLNHSNKRTLAITCSKNVTIHLFIIFHLILLRVAGLSSDERPATPW